MHLFRSLLLLMAFIFLSSCSSMAEHAKYKYVAPDTTSGKQCISRCLVAKSSCEEICAMKHPNCGTTVIKKGKRVTEVSESCKYLCHCTSAYNVCYNACGGQVH